MPALILVKIGHIRKDSMSDTTQIAHAPDRMSGCQQCSLLALRGAGLFDRSYALFAGGASASPQRESAEAKR